MLFIHPMWDSESQRIGKMKCSAIGFKLHVIGEFIGFIGLISLAACLFYVAVFGTIKGFGNISWLTLLVPLVLGVASELMVQASWLIVGRKSFKYDPGSDMASWVENGVMISYSYAPVDNGADPKDR